MRIFEICQKQPFDIISIKPRRTFGLCCVYIAQLATHRAVYTLQFILQLCYKLLGILQMVTKSQKVHISSHNVFQNLYNIGCRQHRSRGFFRVEVEKQKFSVSSIDNSENSQKPFSWNLTVYSQYKMRIREEVLLPIPRAIVDIPVVIKTFKFC